MIEPTDEMVRAFMRAYAEADDGSAEVILEDAAEKAGLAAVLAIVERDRDPTTVGQAAVTAKLYSLAVLDEVSTAVGKLTVDLADIRRRYERELTAGPDQFRNLLAMAEQIQAGRVPDLRTAVRGSPVGETREGLTHD